MLVRCTPMLATFWLAMSAACCVHVISRLSSVLISEISMTLPIRDPGPAAWQEAQWRRRPSYLAQPGRNRSGMDTDRDACRSGTRVSKWHARPRALDRPGGPAPEWLSPDR